MYEFIRQLNENTFIALDDSNKTFIMKQIGLEETEIYKKYMKINHKNVMKVYELTVIGNSFFAVCEYINGMSVSQIIGQYGPLQYNEAKQYLIDILDGLDAIHGMGLVHRDICPNNIMIDSFGRAVIVDFDISRISKINQNADTQLLGTQGFASPEHFGFNQTNSRADIYSFGALMNYMLTGCLPNEKLPGGFVSEIIVKCTKIDENQRYANVSEIKGDIEKKFRLTNFIRKIPGFRKGVWWHTLIAIIYYLFTVICIVFSLLNKEETLKGRITIANLFFWAGIVDVFVVFDWGSWTEKFNLTKNKSKGQKMVFKILLAALISFAAAMLI